MLKRLLISTAILAALFHVAYAADKPQQLPLMPLVKEFPLSEHAWTSVAVSPKGDFLATVEKNTLSVWDWHTGKVVWSKDMDEEKVYKLKFGPTEDRLLAATSATKGWITCFDGKGQLIKRWQPSGIGVADMALSPDGKTLLVARKLALYDKNSIDVSAALLLPMNDGDERMVTNGNMGMVVGSVAWMPNGKEFVVGGGQIGDAATGKTVIEAGGPGYSFGGEWTVVSPDGDLIVAGGTEGMTAYSRKAKRQVWQVKQTYAFAAGDVGGGAFVGDGKLVTWSTDVRLWDTATGDEISWASDPPANPPRRRQIQTFTCADSGGGTVAGIDGRALRIWELPPFDAKPPRNEPGLLEQIVRAAGGDFGMGGDLARVKALLARGAPVRADIWQDQDPAARARGLNHGVTPLHTATSAAIAQVLLDAGADPNAVAFDPMERTPLMKAVEITYLKGPFDLIDLLIAHGAKLDTLDENGSSALHLAIGWNKMDMARHLVEKGAAVDIFSAVALNDVKRVQQLLKDKPDLVNTPHPVSLETPLFWVRDAGMIDLLLAAGANPMAQNQRHMLAGDSLRGNRHQDLVQHLDEQLQRP